MQGLLQVNGDLLPGPGLAFVQPRSSHYSMQALSEAGQSSAQPTEIMGRRHLLSPFL